MSLSAPRRSGVSELTQLCSPATGQRWNGCVSYGRTAACGCTVLDPLRSLPTSSTQRSVSTGPGLRASCSRRGHRNRRPASARPRRRAAAVASPPASGTLGLSANNWRNELLGPTTSRPSKLERGRAPRRSGRSAPANTHARWSSPPQCQFVGRRAHAFGVTSPADGDGRRFPNRGQVSRQ